MKILTKTRRAGVALTAISALIGFVPSASSLVLTYEDSVSGHAVGTPFVGGTFLINLQDFDMGTLYPSTLPGGAAGFGENGTGTQTVAGGISTLNSIQTAGAVGANPAGGEDTWGIARINTITDQFGSIIWSTAGKQAELTVMFYGEQDFYIQNLANNPGYQSIDGVGLHADLWLQSFTDPGFTQYNPGQGSAGRTALDRYTSVTDGTMILSTVSTAGFLHGPGQFGGPSSEFNSVFNPNAGGEGQAYLSVTGGADAAQFNTNGYTSPYIPGNTADLFAQFTTDANPGVSNWLVSSNDPIEGNIARGVPDSGSTLLLFGLGLGFLAEAYRRRRA
jgi:hypothetical protein